MPAIFTVVYPYALYSLINHFKTKKNKAESPYIVYYNVFYLLVFSAIPHKELRFLMPIIPFTFVMVGELMAQSLKKGGCQASLTATAINLFVVIESIVLYVLTAHHHRLWEWEHYLT